MRYRLGGRSRRRFLVDLENFREGERFWGGGGQVTFISYF